MDHYYPYSGYCTASYTGASNMVAGSSYINNAAIAYDVATSSMRCYLNSGAVSGTMGIDGFPLQTLGSDGVGTWKEVSSAEPRQKAFIGKCGPAARSTGRPPPHPVH